MCLESETVFSKDMACGGSRPFDITNEDFEWDYDGEQVKECMPRDSFGRRELRRRLSLDSDDGLPSQESTARTRRSILRERLLNHQRNNLQICFATDDAMHDVDDEESCKDSEPHSVESVNDPCLEIDQKDHDQSQDLPKTLFSKISFKPFFSIPGFSSKETCQPNSVNGQSFQSFEECHEHILSEAKKAMKSAKEMASMQMQLEKQQSKASRVLGIEATKDTPMTQVTQESLSSLTKKQMTSILKKLTESTDNLNARLLKLLEERDELNMEQDSLLMDIEDLTRFLHSQDL